MKSKTLYLMSLVLMCSIMQADEIKTDAIKTPVIKSDFPNLYLGLGISHMSLVDDATNEEMKANGVSLIVGYQFLPYLAIESRYSKDIGNVEYDHGNNVAQTSTNNYPTFFSNLGIYAKPMYQYDDIAPYLLLGYGKTKLINIPSSGSVAEGNNFQWGAGIQYTFTQNISAFVDYIRLHDGKGFGNSAINVDVTAEMYTLGVTYKF